MSENNDSVRSGGPTRAECSAGPPGLELATAGCAIPGPDGSGLFLAGPPGLRDRTYCTLVH
jgi:hypothetical protein